MSLNWIKYSSYLNENIKKLYICINLEKQDKKKKTFDSFTKFIKARFIIIIFFFFMLVVFHLTKNSTLFCYCYIAAEVQFHLTKTRKKTKALTAGLYGKWSLFSDNYH